jgi:hypothetical protein
MAVLLVMVLAEEDEPVLVITSTLAHAAWHLSHSTCRHSFAAKSYPFAATRPRWPPSPKIPIAGPLLVNGTAAARRLFRVTPYNRCWKGDAGSAGIVSRYRRSLS